jgi:hypothetical protein
MKTRPSSAEIDLLTLLTPGTPVEASAERGVRLYGTVQDTMPEQGFFWIYTDSGERKLLDIQECTVRLAGLAGFESDNNNLT